MAARVLLGNHSTYGYGLFISQESISVTGANRANFLFDSTAGYEAGMCLLTWTFTLNSSQTKSIEYNSLGRNTFANIYLYSNATNYKGLCWAQVYHPNPPTVTVTAYTSTRSRLTVTNNYSSTRTFYAHVYANDV